MSRLNLNSSYIFTSEQDSFVTSSMENNSRSRGGCLPVIFCCGGGWLGVLLSFLLMTGIAYFAGVFDVYQDLEPCFDINIDKSFITEMPNISSSIGSEVTVVCTVVNYRFENQKVYWTGPNFEAETGHGAVVKIHNTKAGVTAIGGESTRSFYCSDFLPRNGTVIVPILTFKLTLLPNRTHQGKYTCKTNYTKTLTENDSFKKHGSSKSFFLSVI